MIIQVLQRRTLTVGLPILAALLVAGWIAPARLPLLTQILAICVFAISYDLLEGFGGIVSLGHAAYFGIGAYAAALLAQAGFDAPVLVLVLSALIAGLSAFVLTPIIVRGTDFTRLLVTLGVGSLVYEVANSLRGLTGGADGLVGYNPGKVLGVWEFDFRGVVGFLYAWVVLVVCYFFARMVVLSPFGLTLAGLRERARRMPAVGASVGYCLAVTYAISGTIAGAGGALLAQTNQFVSLDVLGFERSAEIAMMAALGGLGSVYGAVVGAVGFVWVKDVLSEMSPQYWKLGLGVALMAMVLFAPGGVTGLCERLLRLWRRRGS